MKTGRDGPIRTGDPLVPNQMRYHAALHPVYEKRPAVTYALQGFFISLGRNARLELTAPWPQPGALPTELISPCEKGIYTIDGILGKSFS